MSQRSQVLYLVPPHTFFPPSASSRRAVVSYSKIWHKVLVKRLGGLSLPRKSVVILADRLDMTLPVYHGCKTTKQQTVEPFISKQPRKRTGPGCSKLTTSLVNVSLKFQTLISQIRQYFLLCPRDDSQGALRFAPVCPSVCPSVRPSVRSSRFTV